MSLETEAEPPSLDAELLESLSDETTHEITREARRIPDREREIVLGIIRQFADAHEVQAVR